MSDAWDFYFTNVNDVVASVFVDLGIRDSVPNPKLPWLLCGWVYFHDSRPDGLSTSEEAPILGQIEDALVGVIKEFTNAELVGRITTAGHREFYFYGARPDRFEEAVAAALKNFPTYDFDSGTKADPEWAQYLNVLYPSPEEYERIKNLHVVEALEKRRDCLKIPRPVSHWLYFKSPQDRTKFVAKALTGGFKVIDESDANVEADHPYGLSLQRIDHVDWNST